MEVDREFLELMRTEIKSGINLFRQEVKAGFSATNTRIGEMNESLGRRIDETNNRIDETNKRLDSAILMVRDFRKDMSSRLDGMGDYFRSIDSHLMRHGERLESLEQRVDKLEEAG